MVRMAKTTSEPVAQNRGHVLCVILSENQVQSFLVAYGSDGVEILEQSQAVPYGDTKSVVKRVDDSLQDLGKESENIDQVIFGVEHTWITRGDLAPEKQKIITTIADALSLKPQGFVDSLESLIQKQLHISPRSSEIMVEISQASISIGVVIHGDLRGIEVIGRSASIVDDIGEGFARFAVNLEPDGVYLPTKIVLSSLDVPEDTLRKFQQELLAIDWPSQSRFLQSPAIDVLSRNLSVTIIAEEAGKGVALANDIPVAADLSSSGEVNEVVNADEDEPSEDFDFKPVATSVTPVAAATTGAAVATASSVTAGEAVVSPDLLDTKSGEPKTARPKAEFSEAKTFGVPITSKQLAEIELQAVRKGELPDDSEATAVETTSVWSKVLSGVTTLFSRSQATARPASGSHAHNPKRFIVIGVLAGLIALLGLSVLGTVFFSSAVVTIIPNKQLVSKTLSLTLDESATSPDAASLTLPAKQETASLSDESTAPTTGTTLVGESAKGTIEIINKTTSNKIFAAGTEVTTGELTFTFDEEVEVPAAVVEEDPEEKEEVKKFGEATVAVTASIIGSDSNIEGGTELTVASFDSSTYTARATEAFTGGEEREVKVVSEKDRTDIQTAMLQSLLEEVNKEFREKEQNGTRYLPIERVEVVSAEFNREVGDEANEITLKLEVTAETLSYDISDLKLITQEVLQSEVPEGYALVNKEPDILSQPIDPSENEDDEEGVDSFLIKGDVSSAAVPTFENQNLAQDIAGKSIEEATRQLRELDSVKSLSITLRPSLLQNFYSRLPKDQQRIEIKVLVEEE